MPRISYQAHRRLLLTRLLSLGGLPLLSTSAPAGQSVRVEATSASLMDKAFEMKALAIESGDQAYGAVVVKGHRIVGWGPSQVVVGQDPTAHAEMVAIRDAASTLSDRDLGGCIIYATSRPCRMCETAAYWAGIERVYFSADILDAGAPGYSSC